jgi:hypothetical protein
VPEVALLGAVGLRATVPCSEALHLPALAGGERVSTCVLITPVDFSRESLIVHCRRDRRPDTGSLLLLLGRVGGPLGTAIDFIFVDDEATLSTGAFAMFGIVFKSTTTLRTHIVVAFAIRFGFGPVFTVTVTVTITLGTGRLLASVGLVALDRLVDPVGLIRCHENHEQGRPEDAKCLLV